MSKDELDDWLKDVVNIDDLSEEDRNNVLSLLDNEIGQDELDLYNNSIYQNHIEKYQINYRSKTKNNNLNLLDKTEFTGLELCNSNIEAVPKLLDPLFQKVGLAALVGESDSGKSTFLQYLALHVALGKDNFLGSNLILEHKKVIYVSTEDDIFSLAPRIKNQLKSLGKFETTLLNNIEFITDIDGLTENLERKLKESSRDLIIIDCFGDIALEDTNNASYVRKVLDKYNTLAKKYKCLIIFLHHTKKNSGNYITKHNVIGSQSFEAKMRVVLQMVPQKNGDFQLHILKGNYIKYETKQNYFIYNLGKNQEFINSGKIGINSMAKLENTEIVNSIKNLYLTFQPNSTKKFLSGNSIAIEIKKQSHNVSRTVIHEIIKKNKVAWNVLRLEKIRKINFN